MLSESPATHKHCKEHSTPVQLLAKSLHLQEKGVISVESAISLIQYHCNIHYRFLVQSMTGRSVAGDLNTTDYYAVC